jgi:hypothetical protein
MAKISFCLQKWFSYFAFSDALIKAKDVFCLKKDKIACNVSFIDVALYIPLST